MALPPDAHWLTDASGYRGTADSVAIPKNEAELALFVHKANAAGLPVTIAGAGTGLTGGRVPQGGAVVSPERFKRLEISTGRAICGAGVLLQDLQEAASASEQLYPPDPTEWSASIGGNVATNASGSRSFLYGSTRRHVLALRVVLANGDILALKRGDKPPFDLPALPESGARKNTAGYYLRPGMDYLDLFIGSEGTLGIITEAELALVPVPKELAAGVIFFASDAEALDAVDSWRKVPGIRMIEYFDATSLDLMRPQVPGIPGAARAAILVESEGTDWMPDAGLEDSWFALGVRDRERFRRFRHALPETVNALVRQRGLRKLASDFAVPVARNREMLAAYHEVLAPEFGGRYVLFGHIGDAHLHANVLPANEEEWQRARDLLTGLARRAVEFGGTVSAEHGLGKSKRHLLEIQFTPEQIESMKQVKRLLDPHWILGRDTLFEAGFSA